MKIIKLVLICFAVAILGYSCGEEALDPNSIFKADPPERGEFDDWLLRNYVQAYNIDFRYRYDDKESDNTYNLIPADYDKAVALALMVKHIWIEAYNETSGGDQFLKQFNFRVMQLIGSPAYQQGGSIVLGTAEGGIKVTLYNVNIIDIENPYIDVDTPFFNHSDPKSQGDLNHWFFKTMHHEFGHILNQLKEYSRDFINISQANYRSGDWVNLPDSKAPEFGFVSGYSSMEHGEDFVEIASTYVTRTPEAWQKILDAGITSNNDGTVSTKGRDDILAKLEIVKDYYKNTWNLDLDKLRDVSIRRTKEIGNMDLSTLN